MMLHQTEKGLCLTDLWGLFVLIQKIQENRRNKHNRVQCLWCDSDKVERSQCSFNKDTVVVSYLNTIMNFLTARIIIALCYCLFTLCINVCVESPVWLMGDSGHKNKCGMTYLLLWFVQQIIERLRSTKPTPLARGRFITNHRNTEPSCILLEVLLRGKTPNNSLSLLKTNIGHQYLFVGGISLWRFILED